MNKKMKIILDRMEIIFDEWAKRYSENPKSFSKILDEKGKPVSGYGRKCAIYFTKLANELDEKGLLPRLEE